jgi:peptide/nickel transport system substrate-binding protein
VSFLPVGVNGSTEALTKEIGFREDLAKSKQLLAQAGMPDGFKFALSYGNAAIAGVGYQNLAQKLQSDLARVGIKAELTPMDQVNMRTMYLGGKLEAALTFWNPPAPENWLWSSATINRVAGRVHWKVPEDVRKLVADAGAERDLAKGAALYKQVPAGDGRCGPSLRADPAGLSGGGAQERVRPETDGGRLDGRAGRSQAGLMQYSVLCLTSCSSPVGG